jgi:hypothetical protein
MPSLYHPLARGEQSLTKNNLPVIKQRHLRLPLKRSQVSLVSCKQSIKLIHSTVVTPKFHLPHHLMDPNTVRFTLTVVTPSKLQSVLVL